MERAASGALGRRLEIAGSLDVSLSSAPRVSARDVTVANAAWGTEPSMLRVGRVTVVVDLRSLWSGPLRVRELEIDDVRLVLERDGAGRGNWELDREPAPPPTGRTDRPRFVLERAALRGVQLFYRPWPEGRPVTLDIRDLEARLDPATRMLDVRGAGRRDETPWELSSRLGPFEKLVEGRDVELALSARLDTATLEARGRIGELLTLAAPDLEASVEGPDVAAALRGFGVRSPLGGSFRLRARLTPAKGGVDAELGATVGAVSAQARGTLDALLSPGAFHVALEAAGPDVSAVGSWAGIEGLPPWPFELSGRVRREGGRLHLQDVSARVGPTSLAVAGVLGATRRLVGTDLSVRAKGQDLSKLSKLAGRRLPAGPFQLAGRLLRREGGLAIDAVELRWRGAVVHAAGTLGEPPRLLGLDLTVDASASDLAELSGLAAVELPHAPFTVRGRVARDGDALQLDAVEARLGGATASAGGTVVLAKGLAGTALELRVAGPDLARIASFAGVRAAPAEPFEAKGRVRIVKDGYELDGVEGSVGRVSAAVDGHVAATASLDGTSVSCRARGPDLSGLAAWGLPAHLPADPFSIEGRLRVEGGVWWVDGAAATVGADRATVDGALGAPPDLSGLDASVRAAGPSLARLGRFLALAGVAAPDWIPVTAYEVSGRVRRVPSGWELQEAAAKAAGAVVRVEGTVGPGNGLAGTVLRVDASGPDLAGTLGAVPGIPALPFEVSAELAGGLERLAATRVTARLGASDVEGTFSARPREKPPALEAQLRSRRLDLAELLRAGLGARGAGGASTEAARPSGAGRLLPGDPLMLDALRAVDATLRIEVAELPARGLSVRDVVVAGALRSGALRIESAEATGHNGGRISARLALEPTGDGHRLAARGRIEGIRLVDSGTAASPEKAPSLDADFDLAGEGRSLHDIATSLDGAIAVAVGAGRMSIAHERLTSGVARSLLDALNPFRASSDHTDVECGIASATLKKGRASIEPIAMQTDKMTVVGHGEVDFRTENLQLEWTLKPRTGVGLAPGAIANPYVKLGGTLSAPRLEVKRLEAAASAGAAVATMGLTVLAQGFYGRITAEKKVCVDSVVKGPVPR